MFVIALGRGQASRAPIYSAAMNDIAPSASPIRPPEAPVLIAGTRAAVWLEADGRVTRPVKRSVETLARDAPPLLCHARATAGRLGIQPFRSFDILELFAFVHPARFCVPTPKGLATVLDLPLPNTAEDEAKTLRVVAVRLLERLATFGPSKRHEARGLAWIMGRAGWPWAPAALSALAEPGAPADLAPHSRAMAEALRIWNRLKEWQEFVHDRETGDLPVEPVEARARLVRLLGPNAEARPQQRAYAEAAAGAFAPREHEGVPHMVLAEAGTGVGKTLGYIAPSSVWAEKNGGAVWISTYTRNLQRQLDGELTRLYPDPDEKARRVVIRKGRENYLCLLNFEEAVNRTLGRFGPETVALALMTRWAGATRDGDMVGGDFPAWLAGLMGRGFTLNLTDTRGECIYSACPHYRKCFIERTVRRARRASIVVANHALVLVQAALGGEDRPGIPTRYVFDEGHHLFDAADSAFSAHLSGQETAELRRWILGAEERGRSRMKGLRARVEDIIGDDEDARHALEAALIAARALPGPGWHQRLQSGSPFGVSEEFLDRVRQQVYARDSNHRTPYSLECHTVSPVPGLTEAAQGLETALSGLSTPLSRLSGKLLARLDDEADELDSSSRLRIEAVCRSLERRALGVRAWRDMLKALGDAPPPEFIDWFGVDRIDGRDIDVGYHRHWVDPMAPFARVFGATAHGMLVTSASLRDGTGDDDADWAVAESRTGAVHIQGHAERFVAPSPFDYPERTRIFVVADVRRDDTDQIAAAYRELFLASGGGSLGLFTAISRLRAVHDRIATPLESQGLRLLAQHRDDMDVGTLIDIFRAEENSCLLGTDAVRDGVDVPGRSLRMIVFDRVPWPRPDILHKARKAAFGGRGYDEMIVRLRLKQAFGRLVRRADDHGVFVMLDSALPSRLAAAFPEGVEVRRVGLAEAIAQSRAFLENQA